MTTRIDPENSRMKQSSVRSVREDETFLPRRRSTMNTTIMKVDSPSRMNRRPEPSLPPRREPSRRMESSRRINERPEPSLPPRRMESPPRMNERPEPIMNERLEPSSPSPRRRGDSRRSPQRREKIVPEDQKMRMLNKLKQQKEEEEKLRLEIIKNSDLYITYYKDQQDQEEENEVIKDFLEYLPEYYDVNLIVRFEQKDYNMTKDEIKKLCETMDYIGAQEHLKEAVILAKHYQVFDKDYTKILESVDGRKPEYNAIHYYYKDFHKEETLEETSIACNSTFFVNLEEIKKDTELIMKYMNVAIKYDVQEMFDLFYIMTIDIAPSSILYKEILELMYTYNSVKCVKKLYDFEKMDFLFNFGDIIINYDDFNLFKFIYDNSIENSSYFLLRKCIKYRKYDFLHYMLIEKNHTEGLRHNLVVLARENTREGGDIERKILDLVLSKPRLV